MDDNIVKYNTVTDNFGTGIYVRGDNSLLRWNTVTGSMNDSPWRDPCVGTNAYPICKDGVGLRTQGGEGGTGSATAYNNTLCDNEFMDIEDNSGTLTGDENTCEDCAGYVGDGGAGGVCDWNCEGLVDVYYDWDEDQPIGGDYTTSGMLLHVRNSA